MGSLGCHLDLFKTWYAFFKDAIDTFLTFIKGPSMR